MRLNQQEIKTVREVLYSTDPKGHLWLFGSRADDTKKGGDIDLYFETSRPINMKKTLQLEYQLASRCGVKVDLLIRNQTDAEQPIHTIAKQGIAL